MSINVCNSNFFNLRAFNSLSVRLRYETNAFVYKVILFLSCESGKKAFISNCVDLDMVTEEEPNIPGLVISHLAGTEPEPF